MSRDIRSFFVVKNPKSSQQNLDLTTKKTTVKHGQKKRQIIIDSDSEDETNKVEIKRSKLSVEATKITNKKPEIPETKSKYFESHNVSVEDIFSKTPVKRDTSRRIIKKVVSKEDKEAHFDKDFEAELAQLDITFSDITKSDSLKVSKSKEDKLKSGYEETSVILKGVDVDSEKNKKPGYEKSSQFSKGEKNKCEQNKIDCDGVVESGSGLLSKVDKKENEKDLDTIRKSPRKKQPVLDVYISPRKRIKVEDNRDVDTSEDDKDNKLITIHESKNDIITKDSVSAKSLPKKSPSKIFSLNQSPSKESKSRITDKSPHKNVSPSKYKDAKLNGDISEELCVNILKKDNISCGKDSPKEIVAKKILLNEDRDFSNKKGSKNTSDINGKTTLAKKESSNKSLNKDSSPPLKPAISSAPSNLWVERYKPTSVKQIIGQQGDKSCVSKLITWLKNWDKNHTGNKKLGKPSPWNKNDDGAYFKAALLSGPPGVGKTTSAHLVCKELGFDIVEFNASDTRSKRLLHEEVSELLSTKSLSPFFTGKGDSVTKKHVLLMDEVDGMAGNEDRGGVQELISLIKQSCVPVICMCNDRNHPKIRSLSNYCFDLRFSKPRVEQIRGAMMSVCFKEKLKLKPDELADIITSANQDIRLVINHLSMLSLEKTSLANSTKHIKLGPWDIVRKIFSEQDHKSMSIHDKCDLFFHDYSVTPLFVQENYLNTVPHKPDAKNKIKKMELFAKAAQSLSYGDLTERSIRSNNAWGLLPVQAIFSSLVPGEVLEGHLGAQINFPAWFGKNSRQTKMSRLVQELTIHSRLKISGNREAMNLDYLTSLGSAITGPLLRDGTEGVPAALAVLSEYCLVREDMESIAELSTWPGNKNKFADIESKVKAAFTRAYNKTSTPTPYAAVPVKKGRGDVDVEGMGEDDEAVSQDMEEEEEGLEADTMIMVKKKPAGKRAEKDTQPSTSKGNKTSKRGRKK